MKKKNGITNKKVLLKKIGAIPLLFAFLFHFFPSIPLMKFLAEISNPDVEICQLSEDCTCPAATCQCDHGNDVFFSRYTDIQNGNASLSNNTSVLPVSGISLTTCPAHQHHEDEEMAAIGRFIPVTVPQVIYLPKSKKIYCFRLRKPTEISPPEIFHPPCES